MRKAIVLAAAGLLAAKPLAAELVVFESGRHVSVKGFEVVDDEVRLDFLTGGSMTIPLVLVDRIVDDELDPLPPEPPPVAAIQMPPPRSVRTFAPLQSLTALPFASPIQAAARRHGIDPALISAVIRVESNFSPRAVSRKGARGLMQLMPATAKRLGVRRSFDPAENVLGGTAYLAELAKRFGETNVTLVLAAYNAGERAVEDHKGIPPYRETREYVKRVIAIWNQMHGT